jgi:DNA/RNA-binding domain of Phe-tRNA-synthetase-like protein
MNLSIHPELKRALPSFSLGCVCATVRVEKHNAALGDEISAHLAHLTASIKPEQINAMPQIAAMRSAYKALGKDRSRYRGSAEALLRRVLSGKGLYRSTAWWTSIIWSRWNL